MLNKMNTTAHDQGHDKDKVSIYFNDTLASLAIQCLDVRRHVFTSHIRRLI